MIFVVSKNYCDESKKEDKETYVLMITIYLKMKASSPRRSSISVVIVFDSLATLEIIILIYLSFYEVSFARYT